MHDLLRSYGPPRVPPRLLSPAFPAKSLAAVHDRLRDRSRHRAPPAALPELIGLTPGELDRLMAKPAALRPDPV
jgi:hypothetical protein